MKTKQIKIPITLSCLIGVILVSGGVPHAIAATLNWTGASLATPPVWSDTNNWDIHALPAPADTVVFGAVGATNAAGLVNNELSSNIAIASLNYQAIVSLISLTNNYHTTQIDPGLTLSIQQGTNSGSLINVGSATDPGNVDAQYYYTITGSGRLVAGNTNAPASNQGLQVTAVQRSFQNHTALLDLSGLDYFSLAGGFFWVGINGANTIPTDRPNGTVYLAKTNLIIMTGTNFDAQNLGSFRIGESVGNTPTKPSILLLGQENSIYTPWLKVGGLRSGALAPTFSSGAFMDFRSGLINPTLKLRGTDGVSRLGSMRIGDNSGTTGGSIPAYGEVDLSGGTVDALVGEMFVGYGPDGTATAAGAAAIGKLTWTAGTFDVSTLYLGYQLGNNVTTNTGIVNLVGANAKLIADRLVLGHDAGGSAGGGVGILNIDGGTVEIGTSLAEDNTSGGNVSSTIILTNNGTLNLSPAGDANGPAVANFDTLQYSSGTVSNGTLALTTINLYSPAAAFEVDSGLTLAPAGPGTVGTLAVNGGLTLNGGALAMDLGTTRDNISVSGALTLSGTNSVAINVIGAVGPGTYPLITYASLAAGGLTNLQLTGTGIFSDTRYIVGLDNTAPNISLTVSGTAANLTWSGGNNANTWDLKSTANWNGGSQQFFQFDQVTFDDSGNASSPVLLSGSLFPQSVTFAANSRHYTLAGTGKITGTDGVSLNGGARVTLLTTNNDYTGGTTINAGILEIGDGATADGTLAGNVANNSELDFNPVFSNNVTANLTGSGTIVKNGPGTTRVSGGNGAFTGPATVNLGTLQAGSATSFGSSFFPTYVTVNSGGTIDLAGNALTNAFLLDGAGAGGNGAFINSAPGSVGLRDVELAGDTTFGGTGGWTVQQSSATGIEVGLLANEFKITKVGTNQVAVNGLNSKSVLNLDLGAVDIQAGQFTLIGYVTMGSQVNQPITVFTNGILGLRTFFTNVLTKTYVLNDGSVLWGFDGSATIDGSVTLNGTTVFDANANVTMTVNCPVTGGTLIKGVGIHPNGGTSTGAGTLLLAGGANTLSGFQVQAGTVALTNSSTISAPQLVLAGGTLSVLGRTDRTLTLASGQSLVGKGAVLGFVSSPAGTSVTPLATNGIITVSSNLTLRGTTTLDLNRSASGVVTNSQIVMGTNATLDCGGILILTSSGQPLQNKDTFKLFKTGTIVNPFTDASITYPTLGAGLFWTNRIAIDGTVAVAATEPTNPPALSVAVNAGPSLSINWPSNYVSFVLQVQTNSLGAGLGTNWTIVGTTNNQINLPINQANGAVFLRLIKQ